MIPGNRQPSTGMAWLLLILIAPFIGFVVFLLLGSARIDASATRSRAGSTRSPRPAHGGVADSVEGPRTSVGRELNHNLGALPMLGSNRSS